MILLFFRIFHESNKRLLLFYAAIACIYGLYAINFIDIVVVVGYVLLVDVIEARRSCKNRQENVKSSCQENWRVLIKLFTERDYRQGDTYFTLLFKRFRSNRPVKNFCFQFLLP